jgi:hypothetical protein
MFEQANLELILLPTPDFTLRCHSGVGPDPIDTSADEATIRGRMPHICKMN